MSTQLQTVLRDSVLLGLLLLSAIAAGQWVGQRWQSAQRPPLAQDFDPQSLDLNEDHPPILISNSTCPACAHTRSWLQAEGIAFHEWTVDQSEHARQAAEQLDVRYVPTLLIGRARINGFDEAELRRRLRPAPQHAGADLAQQGSD